MSLTPDVEKGSQFPIDIDMASDAVGRRRVSPPALPNRRKVSGHEESSGDEITAGWLQGRDNSYLGDSALQQKDNNSYLANDGMHRSLRLRLSPRAAYGWLHAQSGYIFLLVVFLAFLRAGLHAAAPPPAAALAPPPPDSFTARAKSWIPGLAAAPARPHPIPALMDAADARFRAKLARQSPDLPAAVAEYTRRYARAPPRGFDRWYAYARAHGFVMVDEFDGIAEDLAPFWEMGGRELRERARVVGGLPSVDLVRVRGGKAETVKGGDGRFVDSEVSARAAGFKAMLTKFVKELPDMDFPINAKAEGRVVVPWEHKNYPNTTEDVPPLDPATFRPDWAGAGSVWDAWRRTCAPATPARRLYNSISANAGGGGGARDWLTEAWRARVGGVLHQFGAKNTAGANQTGGMGKGESEAGAGGGSHAGIGTGAEFAFTRETGAGEVDFCQAPSAHYEQGHFFSDWRVLPTLVPVFSPARARGFGDIRIPSHYYYGGTRRYTYGWDPVNLEQRPVDAMEVPWEAKRDVVWWRGASTGGGSSPPGFGRGYQRHRFLRMSSLGIVPGTLADAGRTTAVTFAVPPQRETLLTQERAQEPYTYSSSSTSTGGYTYTNTYTTVPVPLGALNADVMDTAFTKAVVPIGAEHRFGDSTELGVAWGYKYLLDLDGMGYSGRFMAFLASDSVPVKATVYDEFFSGWIEPWVHYIPLSATYSEIYNIVAYFSGPPPSALRAAQLADPNTASTFRGSTYRPPGLADALDSETGAGLGAADGGLDLHQTGQSTPRVGAPGGEAGRPEGQVERRGVVEGKGKRDVPLNNREQQQPVRSAAQEEGDRRLRRIARAGKQWKQTIGRTVDMEIYVYRLALEYARLWADDREAMSYKP